MRDPRRIEPFLQKLAEYWKAYVPDWRFGQLMSNFLGFVASKTRQDVFFMEDDELEEWLKKFFDGLKGKYV